MNPVLSPPPSPRAASIPALRLFGDPARVRRTPGTITLFTCRTLSLIMAAAGLVLLAPLMLAIALAVRLSSPGPIFYSQTRVGVDRRGPRPGGSAARRKVDYGGRLFRIYKFRTMRADPNASIQVWARPDDNRITPVGRFLRRYRLDELPQLWNVVRGDMNMVGPRPEQPSIFLSLREQISDYPRRQRVLPGITGLAQVSQPYDACLDDVRNKLRFDLDYIERMSPLQDLLILARTVPVVLLQRGGW
ncbi:MAG TPA: sugar transferase [Longimicrobium sp.]|nr:sugar transferase [Longimicrobium sp.]